MSPPPVNSIRLHCGWRVCAVDSLFVTSGSEWYSGSSCKIYRHKIFVCTLNVFSVLLRKQKKKKIQNTTMQFQATKGFLVSLSTAAALQTSLYAPALIQTDAAADVHAYARAVSPASPRGASGTRMKQSCGVNKSQLDVFKVHFFKGGRRQEADKPGWFQSNLGIVEGK